MKTAMKKLEPATRKWVKTLIEDYGLEDHDKRLAILAGQAWDRAQDALAIIKRGGAIIEDRFEQKKAHPAVDIQRNSMVTYARLLRELCLDAEPEDPIRPPKLRY